MVNEVDGWVPAIVRAVWKAWELFENDDATNAGTDVRLCVVCT